MSTKKIADVVLPATWMESEKGNTMVTNDDGGDGGIAAWIHIEKNIYMEITDNPSNSPRFYVTFIESTPAKLRKAIRKNCEGWYCVRWNVDDKPPTDKENCIR